MTTSAHPQPRPDRIAAQQHREAAFLRIVRVRGASVVGAGALTAALAAVVSAVAPGQLRAKPRTAVALAKPVTPARATATVRGKLPPLASPGSLGLGSPSGAPQSAPTSSPQSAPQSTPPAQQSAPTQPTAPTQQAAPAPSQSGPVVSGGS